MFTRLAQSGHTAYGLQEFAIDTPADLDMLPIDVPMGSTAICISTGAVYMINSSRKWVEI